MAPTKTILTIDTLDEHTALELPERELMCGCGSLLTIGVGANVNLGGTTATTCTTVTAGSTINVSASLGVSLGTSGCNS